MLSDLPSNRQELNQISSGESQEFSDSETETEQELERKDQVMPLKQEEEVKKPEMVTSQFTPKRDRVSTMELCLKINEVQKSIKVNNSKEVKSNFVKRMVSKQKQRFELDGFDLDLTCINVTPNLIAMGFPANDVESLYRNSMDDVKKFFNSRHPDHYMIYNLCEERKYHHSNFNGKVREYPFVDHQPPPFKMIFDFCEDVAQYLAKDPENVVGIHCKAGKGRTGLMVCAYLLYSKFLESSYDIQRYFGLVRTKNRQGITIPSQIRYLNYFEQALKYGWTKLSVPHNDVQILKIVLHTIPNFRTLGGCDPWFRVQNQHMEYVSHNFGPKKGLKSLEMKPEDLIVSGDVLFQFFNNSFKSSKEKMFQFWINTSFVTDTLFLKKCDIDQAIKDKTHKKFHKDFSVEIYFCQAPQTVRRRSKLVFQMEDNLLERWESYEIKAEVEELNIDQP